MDEKRLLLVDLDRCTGCHVCEVGCKQWNNTRTKWVRVRTIGPESVDGELRMRFFPEITDKCNFCGLDAKGRTAPFCVDTCPTNALTFCTSREALTLLNHQKPYQICRFE